MSRPRRQYYSIVIVFPLLLLVACEPESKKDTVDSNPSFGQQYDYLRDYNPALSLDSHLVNAIVEIPAGRADKWEVNPGDGHMYQDSLDGLPRVVNFLPYPANYGMIPRSVMSEVTGGDGDPLDILILDSALERCSLHRVRIIGALKLLDNGEVDDKLIAVTLTGKLSGVTSISELNQLYPGITIILETWFDNYKGPGKMEPAGFVDVDSALIVTLNAINDFTEAQ